MPNHITRRNAISLLAAITAAPFLPNISQAKRLATLSLWGPPASPTITLAHAVATNQFSEIAEATTFTAWRNPDELRAGLTSGSIIASIVPVQAAANLYNRGFPIKMANIMTEGLLYVLSEDESIKTIADLKGRKIAVPFKGDTPEILFTQLLRHHKIEETDVDVDVDVDVSYVSTPIEAIQLLLAGRVETAMVVEPASSAAVIKGKKAGKNITRVIDITQAWGEMTGGQAIIPMAGLAVSKTIYEDMPELITPLHNGLSAAVKDVVANPMAAAKNAAEGLSLPVPVVAASIPNSRLIVKNLPKSEQK